MHRTFFCDNENVIVTFFACPKQRDGHGFGIFAVGSASEIFDGKSSTDAVFHIPQLCNDLIYCLERRALTPFTKISIKKVNKASEELLY